MSPLSTVPDARRRAALGAGAEVRLGAGLAALILALLVRLFGRTDAAWHALPEHAYDRANHAGACPYAIVTSAIVTSAIVTSAIGRAPHAAWIESGRVPDWILPGIRNRGMRPAAPPARLRPRALPARAPPTHAPPGAHPVPC